MNLKVTFLWVLLPMFLAAGDVAQWRGVNRDGHYNDTKFASEWPLEGPEQLWMNSDVGSGYASVSVLGDRVYVTGRKDSIEYFSVLDQKGKMLWQIPYGGACKQSFAETRCTPTIQDGAAYVISGRGEVVRINLISKRIAWSVPAFEQFEGAYGKWEIAESPLLVDDKVIYTPAGPKTTMIALDQKDGSLVWQTESLGDSSAYSSPILINYGGKDMIINVIARNLFGVDAANGRILWHTLYGYLDPPEHPIAPMINTNSPLYQNGQIFVTSGYDHIGAMYQLSEHGNSIDLLWKQPVLDTHHGGVVLVNEYIYGSNWINNRQGNWLCLDWDTGEVQYDQKWETKGSIISVNNQLILFDEKRGNVALLNANPKTFEVISSFQVTEGKGPYWAHPVVADGILYLRHGENVMAYNTRK